MTVRLRNQRFTFGAKRRPVKPVKYERVDDMNTRIGNRWFKYTRLVTWNNGVMEIIHGVTITDGEVKRFIANSFYGDINTDKL